MSVPLSRQTRRKRPLPAASKKKIAKSNTGTLLKKVTYAELAETGWSRPEIGYILAFIHQIGDRLKREYPDQKQDAKSIARYFAEPDQ
ncbi:hypothetical protein [Hymenobacter defluvii]|uniref:Uncharacterized protein n=1 Tax=Hymenobacter defluvii TaxID=2054411 RepID=A0ABS3THI3_9BACT|nr:hypothetical protein [Hymenobacter defluvii]MBO3273116.1 hypothetical protein [Hymenobacter defluvii]